MNPARRIAALGALIVTISGLNACGDSGELLARVGTSPITSATVDHWVSVMADGPSATDRSSARYRALRGQVLGFLISSQWTLGEAAEVGVKATDREAQAQLELLRFDRLEGVKFEGIPQQGQLPLLFAHAHTQADRLWLMKLALLTSRVKEKQLTEAARSITHDQIASYYDQHKSQFVLPERRDVVWIVTYSPATLKKAIDEIRAGKSFYAVAKRVSLDEPTIIGMDRHPAAEKQLAKHAFAAKPHVITGPFRQSQNYYSFEVTKVTPARLQTLAQSEAAINRRLATGLASTALPMAFTHKWTGRTSCGRYVVPGCRQYRGTA